MHQGNNNRNEQRCQQVTEQQIGHALLKRATYAGSDYSRCRSRRADEAQHCAFGQKCGLRQRSEAKAAGQSHSKKGEGPKEQGLHQQQPRMPAVQLQIGRSSNVELQEKHDAHEHRLQFAGKGAVHLLRFGERRRII